jgi:hypothetical protein
MMARFKGWSAAGTSFHRSKLKQFASGLCASVVHPALLAVRVALNRRRLHSLQHRMASATTRDQDRQRDGRNREDDRTPRGHLGENIDGSAWAKGSLRALAAKRTSQICTLAGLQQDNPDKNKTKDNVKDGKQINH